MAGEEQFMAGFMGGAGPAKTKGAKKRKSQRAAEKIKAGGPSGENRKRFARNRKRQRNLFGRVKANVDQGE